MKLIIALVAFLGLLSQTEATRGLVGACKTKTYATKNVDLSQYSGKWYEISSSDSFFWGRGCYCTTAEYTPQPDGTISVRNECRQDSVTGKKSGNTGKARVKGPGKLAVNFAPIDWRIFDAPYDIVALDEKSYQWAAIVSCSNTPVFGGSNVWVISRKPTLDESTLSSIYEDLKTMGFDLSDQTKTEQQGCVY
ncbi:Calycin-like protein [Paraphysoderma sedebokerense]|nr:Calycin-like protein [Paraphysoderma sedebokerense]